MQFSNLTPEQLEKASAILKAISHPVRLAIMNFLEDGKMLTVTQLHEMLKIEQSTTSHHLGILKDKGILSSKREGKNTYYFIKDKNLFTIVDCVGKCACT